MSFETFNPRNLMSSMKENAKDQELKSSVVNKFGEPSQWNVEVLVRFKCDLPEVLGEEILEVSDVLSASEFAGKVAQIFSTQIYQSGGKFLIVKKRDKSPDVYVPLKMSDVGFLRDGDVFEVHTIVSPDQQDGSTLYALVRGMPQNVNPFNALVVSSNTSSHSVAAMNSQRPPLQPYQPHFYPPVASFANSVGPTPVYYPTPYNSVFRNASTPMHPSVSQFFGSCAVPKPSLQPVSHISSSPSSLSHSWNNSRPNQSSHYQVGQQKLKQELEKQRQQQQEPTSFQKDVILPSVNSSGNFSPPTNLVHLFIPVHWKNYPRILHGAIEEVLDESALKIEQKIEMRKLLIETIVNGRVQSSSIQPQKDALFGFLDKVKANLLGVLGEAQSTVPSDSSSKSYAELKKKNKRASGTEKQSRALSCNDIKKVKLEPGSCEDTTSNFVNCDPDAIVTIPVLEENVSAAERFSSPDSTSDCLIIIQERCFHLNKGLLSVNSVVLQELLKKQVQLEINDLNADNFLRLIDFIYPSDKQCIVTEENVEILLNLALRFQMAEVLRRCEKFLMSSSNNVAFTLAKRLFLAQEFGLSNLKDSCVKQCISMDDLKVIRKEKEYKMFKDKTIVELVENMSRNGD